MASTSVPPAVASDETVAQFVIGGTLMGSATGSAVTPVTTPAPAREHPSRTNVHSHSGQLPGRATGVDLAERSTQGAAR